MANAVHDRHRSSIATDNDGKMNMQPTTNTDVQAGSMTPPAVVIYTTREAASYLGLSVSTLNKWRCYGFGPKYLKLGRAVRYRREELDHYLNGRLIRSTLGN